jgi:DNA repair protein RecO (recombination protein O)
MTDSSVFLQPAFILQQRNFRESSLLIDALTRDFGRISLVAKGVRKPKSKMAGILQPFVPLVISYLDKTDLKTLTAAEAAPSYRKLEGTALYCGFYLNELIVGFFQFSDPHPELFYDYCNCINELSNQANQESALRNFELSLLNQAGYGLQLSYAYPGERPIESNRQYHFDLEKGLVEAENGLFSGASLRAIRAREFSDPDIRFQAKQLLRLVIDAYCPGRPLKSRAIMNQFIKLTKHA